MNRIEKFNAKKCNVKIVLNNDDILIYQFIGDETPYQEYIKSFLSRNITYLSISGASYDAIRNAKQFIESLPDRKVFVFNNKMINFNDIKSAEIIDIEDYFVDVELRKQIDY